MTSINQGIYIANNSGGYWEATPEQKMAYKNFPFDSYSGMGSTHWMGNDEAKEKVKGIENHYNMVLKYNSTLFLKTSDGIYRHIFEIKRPPTYKN